MNSSKKKTDWLQRRERKGRYKRRLLTFASVQEGGHWSGKWAGSPNCRGRFGGSAGNLPWGPKKGPCKACTRRRWLHTVRQIANRSRFPSMWCSKQEDDIFLPSFFFGALLLCPLWEREEDLKDERRAGGYRLPSIFSFFNRIQGGWQELTYGKWLLLALLVVDRSRAPALAMGGVLLHPT